MHELPWSRAAIEQAVALAGPRAAVRHISALAGGTHAHTYLIQTSNPEVEVILREFPAGDAAACHEAQVLTALDGLSGLAPRLLASGPGGTPPAGPWNLISRLPGAADITPARPPAFAAQLGDTLARIHATPQTRLIRFSRVLDRPGGSIEALSGPAASLVAARQDLLISAPGVLTHYDFWSGNTLWLDGTLTGVVDWSGAAVGPRGFDVGWCRLDLYLLYDRRIADCFLGAYEAASGNTLTGSLLWDLWAVARSYQDVESWVPNYHDLSRSDLTATELRKRHTQWSRYLLGRSTSTTF
jgi:aminoglycoside phosphotransferase (APT) family kinase protein